jgi:hypothetical protein
MHYELWDTAAGNRLATAESKDEAFAIARAFLEDGWHAEELVLGALPGPGESAEGLPLTGAALKEQAFSIHA